MSDSMDSFDSLANRMTPGEDPLPPDLALVHDRVVRDSALWRAGLPSTDALAQQVTSLSQRKPESRHVSYRIREELQMQDPPYGERPDLSPTPPALVTPRHPQSRTKGFIAGGAALVLVALFVALFAALSHGGQTGKGGSLGTAHATATATVTAAATATATTPQGFSGNWHPIASLTHTASVPVINPQYPNVVYDVANGVVRRSTDAGATWTNLPNPTYFPAGDTPQWMDLFVSPFDGNRTPLNIYTLWTTAVLTNPNGPINCPVPGPTAFAGGNVARGNSNLYSENINLGGSIPCQVQNVSTDGGQTWNLVKLPFAFMLGTATPDTGTFNPYDPYSAPPQAEGTVAYTLTSDGPLASSSSGGHVAVSLDGGDSWQDDSAQLTASGLDVCDLAAVRGGWSLFAVANGNGCSLDGATAPSLWRDDEPSQAGHWSQVTLPPNRFVIRLFATAGASQPKLFAQTATLSHTHAANTTTLATDFFASTDGGKTWIQAPAAGVAAHVVGSGPMTVLSNGTMVVPFSTQPDASGLATYTFEEWQPGSNAWQPLSHLSLYGIAQFQTLPDLASGADVLWLTIPDSANPQSSTFSVATYLP